MSKAIPRNKLCLVAVILCLALTLTATSSVFAWRGHGGYYWHGGYWGYGDAIVSGLVVGATIASLPPYYSTVYVGGVPYYYDGTYYYQPASGGYVVAANPTIMAPAAMVTAPGPVAVAPATTQVITPAPSASSNTVTINIPNSRGGYTPVVLTKKGDGYVGPQGEYYKGHFSVEQLKSLYGK